MNLAISNIAWTPENDDHIYYLMKEYGYQGLEIAPTRVFGDHPYHDLRHAAAWRDGISARYGFSVPSMQSIWFGISERLFGTDAERRTLLDYTMKAIDFAEVIGCRNLVFGCPKNRIRFEDSNEAIAVGFFRKLGDYALKHHTVIGMEANPPIYHTNYINTTREAIDLIHRVGSEGFKLNLDVGTMVYNEEDIAVLAGEAGIINHVHISEPGLGAIQERELHGKLRGMLGAGYKGFISIEMSKDVGIDRIEGTMRYVGGVFR